MARKNMEFRQHHKVHIKDHIKITKKKVKEFLNGQMEADMRVHS